LRDTPPALYVPAIDATRHADEHAARAKSPKMVGLDA